MTEQPVYLTGFGGVGFGVWWAVWGVLGFWHGVLYGMLWPIWVGYHLAHHLLGR